MKQLTLLLIYFLLLSSITSGQITRNNDVTTGGSTSSGGSAPLSTTRYQRVAYIVPSSELAAAGILNGTTINSIGFVFCGLSEAAASGTLKVWLQNTSDASYLKSTTLGFEATGGVTDGMTLVRNAAITLPGIAATPGTEQVVDFPFTGGTTSSFAYTGGNLYIAFEYTNAAGTLPTVANNVYCNSSTSTSIGTNGLRRSTSTTAMPTTAATASSFRPYTRLGSTNLNGAGITNDAAVLALYTLGTLPIPSSNNHVIQAMVKNNGDNTLTNLTVSLSVTGANTFADTKQVASLAPGNVAMVTFNGFSATTAGNNTVTVSVPADAVSSNDSKSITQVASPNTYSMAYGNTTNASTGATAATEHLIRFNTTTTITIDQVASFFSTAGAAYTVTIRDASGPNGLPGAVPLWESTSQTTVGGGVANNVTVSPALTFSNTTTNGNFYIGIRQSGTTSITLLTQQNDEVPMRQNTFYTSTSAVSSLTAFSPTGFSKYIVEPRFSSALPVSLVSFAGNKLGAINKLWWETANEQNNKGFELQRSVDGANFSTITFIASKAVNGNSAGAQKYEFTDEYSSKGNAYYRLKQIDVDGKATLSNTVMIKGTGVKGIDFSILYPNPATDKLNLVLTSESSKKLDIAIFDVTGKLVMIQSVLVKNGDNNIQLNIGKLYPGNYILKTICEEGCEQAFKKFTKQ